MKSLSERINSLISVVMVMGMILSAALFFACSTPEASFADKKNYAGDNDEFRKKFNVTFNEDEKPLRYGYHYIVSKVPEGYKVRVFHPDKKVMTEEKVYSTPALTLMHGYYEGWWDDGSIHEQGNYQYGRKHGVWLESEPGMGKSSSGEYENHRKQGIWTTLDTSGIIESVYVWHDNKRHGKFFLYDSAGQKINEGLYRNDTLIAELFKLPRYMEPIVRTCDDELVLNPLACTDGFVKQFIYSELRYPPKARQNDMEGSVLAQWEVMPDGSVKNIRVPQSLSIEVENEVLRVLNNMPAWNPAKKDGMPIKWTMSLPIHFSL